jgi:hypothetical protein
VSHLLPPFIDQGRSIRHRTPLLRPSRTVNDDAINGILRLRIHDFVFSDHLHRQDSLGC